MSTPLYSTLFSIREKLKQTDSRLVLAESCTAGMAAAELGQIPGISEFFCGSMVVYQTDSKIAWLGIDAQGLSDPDRGPVSAWASAQLVEALLRHTPNATIAAAVTGHFGPQAPAHLDGRVYFSLGKAGGNLLNQAVHLESPAPVDSTDWDRRRQRQCEATAKFLKWIEISL